MQYSCLGHLWFKRWGRVKSCQPHRHETDSGHACYQCTSHCDWRILRGNALHSFNPLESASYTVLSWLIALNRKLLAFVHMQCMYFAVCKWYKCRDCQVAAPASESFAHSAKQTQCYLYLFRAWNTGREIHTYHTIPCHTIALHYSTLHYITLHT